MCLFILHYKCFVTQQNALKCFNSWKRCPENCEPACNFKMSLSLATNYFDGRVPIFLKNASKAKQPCCNSLHLPLIAGLMPAVCSALADNLFVKLGFQIPPYRQVVRRTRADSGLRVRRSLLSAQWKDSTANCNSVPWKDFRLKKSITGKQSTFTLTHSRGWHTNWHPPSQQHRRFASELCYNAPV